MPIPGVAARGSVLISRGPVNVHEVSVRSHWSASKRVDSSTVPLTLKKKRIIKKRNPTFFKPFLRDMLQSVLLCKEVEKGSGFGGTGVRKVQQNSVVFLTF